METTKTNFKLQRKKKIDFSQKKLDFVGYEREK